MDEERPPQKSFTVWWTASIRILLHRDGTYEAQFNKDDYQFRGNGATPREAIIDAMDSEAFTR